MVSVDDVADRPARTLGDGETLCLGRHTMRWFDTPHLPHGWECGLMMDTSTRTFFCGDLFTRGGAGTVPLVESGILGPSEAFRKQMDYFAHAPESARILGRLADQHPATLACMHGSAWRGDGAALLRALAQALVESPAAPLR
jgi:glyoxylase-like metal-dependent hydrolase (beta-lactamase superfamily II)